MSNTQHSEWLSLKDVRQLLGIGRTKAYELVVTGELPAVRIGRCIRINRRELDEWLQEQRYLNSYFDNHKALTRRNHDLR
jgi:excisionase family DNA binding protein